MKTILITGATSGVGLEAAVALGKQGHRLVLVGRDAKKMEAALADVKQRGTANVEALLCDFGSQAQVRKLAAEVRAKHHRLDVLLNNAGLITKNRELTEDGIERTFAVNHLGYFLFTHLLLDLVVKSAPARIVNVASETNYQGTMNFDDLGFEKGGWMIMRSYARSKLANVMFTRSLARRLEGQGVTVNAIHPGGVATPIYDKAPWYAQPMLKFFKWAFLVTPEEGGRRLVYGATSPELEGKTGLYLENDRPQEPSKLALDEALCERLWVESEKLVKLTG